MLFQQRLNPGAQFVLLICFGLAGWLISGIIAIAVGSLVLKVPLVMLSDELMKPENISINRLLQVLTTFLVMAVPALLVSYLSGGDTTRSLGLRQRFGIIQLAIVILMVFFSFMVSDALAVLNKMIPVGATAEKLFKEMEDRYSKTVMSIANMRSLTDYIFSLIILALLPSIFEELLFRGSLQQIMIGITNNAFAGILVASILFSLFHGSFYGFLPRLVLGMLLGYIFYFSKNLWLGIAAHFLNNAYTLTVIYLLGRSGKPATDALKESFSWYYGLGGLVAIIFLLMIFKKESDKRLPPVYQEQNDNYEGLA